MDYFPLFIQARGRRILMVGGSRDIVHKLRLVMKTSGSIDVFGNIEDEQIAIWRDEQKITHHDRLVRNNDTEDAAFAYICNSDRKRRDAAMAVFNTAALPYCVIDDQSRSRFITPAVVDRDPVVVAIGSEGTGPVMTRKIKSEIDAILPAATGVVAEVAGAFRRHADALPKGAPRRRFWSRYFDVVAPQILAAHSLDSAELKSMLTTGLEQTLLAEQDVIAQENTQEMVAQKMAAEAILPVIIAGGLDLLTRKAMRLLHDADVVVYDRGLPAEMLELARRESHHLVVDAPGEASYTVARHLKDGLKAVYLSLDGDLMMTEDDAAMAGVAFDYLPYVPCSDSSLEGDVFPLLPYGTAMSTCHLRKA
jgi:uroporphyrin-III C-methyltransferase/precorrin-2 dehydrogenase/sirohydrochlorin ferrochelatase